MSRRTSILVVALAALCLCYSVQGQLPVIQSQLGVATVDGIISPGEWSEWSSQTLELGGGATGNPPSTISANIAARNTGYNFYLAIRILNQEPANASLVVDPPYHRYIASVWLYDFYQREVEGHLVSWYVSMATPGGLSEGIEGTDPVTLISAFNPLDPSRPSGVVAYEASGGGVYTIEICFPLTSLPPSGDYPDDMYNLGLRPLPNYTLSFFWAKQGDDYRYEHDVQVSILSAFDAMPLIILGVEVLVVIIVLAALVVICRRRRRTG